MTDRLAWFLARHPRFARPVHRLLHRTPGEACWLCRGVWAWLERDAVFVEGMRRAAADFAEEQRP